MPDITDQILNQQPYVYADDYYDPNDKEELSQIAARFMNTHYDLDYRPHWDNDQLDECILEIKQSMLDWVSAGLIAKWVSRYRMWQKKFSSWKDFCLEGLKRDPWKIKKLIEHAQIMVDLTQYGFEVLPSNQSQVEKLSQCAKKLGCLIYEAWSKVISELPERFITADAIAETLGFPCQSVRKKLSRELVARLNEEALDRGLTVEEMLAADYGLVKKEDELEDDEVAEPEPEAIERWQADLVELVAEHEGEIWLLCTLTKLANSIRSKVNQFSWLREYRCRTT